MHPSEWLSQTSAGIGGDSRSNAAVSGLLDLTKGGESVPTVEHGPGTYIIDPEHPGRYRRSVYITSQRSRQPAILKTFDGPVMETNWPQRSSSTVAPQALTLMNHPFVREAAAALAYRIETSVQMTTECGPTTHSDRSMGGNRLPTKSNS